MQIAHNTDIVSIRMCTKGCSNENKKKYDVILSGQSVL